MKEAIIVTEDVHRVFRVGAGEIRALQGVTLEVPARRMVALVGPSGSGKSTLLNLIAGLDRPTRGAVYVQGRNMAELSEDERLEVRRQHLGFIFQTFGLLPLLTAEENVEIPVRMVGLSRAKRQARSAECLSWVGLRDRARHRPYELSGGEQQRVAIARALANWPPILLADEPTGQLDTQTGQEILLLLRRLTDEMGMSVLIVSHDPAVQDVADVVHQLLDGRLVEAAE